MIIHSEPTPSYWPRIWITLTSWILLTTSCMLLIPTVFEACGGTPKPIPLVGLLFPLMAGLMAGLGQFDPTTTTGEGG